VGWVERLFAGRQGSDDLRAGAALALAEVPPILRGRAIALLSKLLEGKRGLLATLRGDGTEESPAVLVAMARALLTLDRAEGTRIIRLRAGKADPELRTRFAALLDGKP
jgi:hypothetical protein